MNLTVLQSFCLSWGDLSTPFYTDNFIYATNGNLAVRVPNDETYVGIMPENGNRKVAGLAEKLDEHFVVDYSGRESHTLSDFDFDLEATPCEYCEGTGKLYACDECNGAGEVSHSTDYNNYEHECDSCSGKGHFKKSEWESEFPRLNVENADYEECEDCDGVGTTGANPHIIIDGAKFQGKLLKKFMQFKGATIKVDAANKPALIEWEGGQGILMSIVSHKN